MKYMESCHRVCVELYTGHCPGLRSLHWVLPWAGRSSSPKWGLIACWPGMSRDIQPNRGGQGSNA